MICRNTSFSQNLLTVDNDGVDEDVELVCVPLQTPLIVMDLLEKGSQRRFVVENAPDVAQLSHCAAIFC